jgi:hypothetical protein
VLCPWVPPFLQETVEAEQRVQRTRKAPKWVLPYKPSFTPKEKLQATNKVSEGSAAEHNPRVVCCAPRVAVLPAVMRGSPMTLLNHGCFPWSVFSAVGTTRWPCQTQLLPSC